MSNSRIRRLGDNMCLRLFDKCLSNNGQPSDMFFSNTNTEKTDKCKEEFSTCIKVALAEQRRMRRNGS